MLARRGVVGRFFAGVGRGTRKQDFAGSADLDGTGGGARQPSPGDSGQGVAGPLNVGEYMAGETELNSTSGSGSLSEILRNGILTAFVVTRDLGLGEPGGALAVAGAGLAEREGVGTALDFLHGAGMKAQWEAKRTVQAAEEEEEEDVQPSILSFETVQGKKRLYCAWPAPS